MSQIFRYAHRTVPVPDDLPDGTRWVLESWTIEIFGADEPEGVEWLNNYEDTLEAIERIGPVAVRSDGLIEVDGPMLSELRNQLDTETLAWERECEENIADGGPAIPDGVLGESLCGACAWCQSIVARDRIDYWMDRAGVPKSLYIGDVASDVEELWRKVAA